jgi:hypothetical protein
MQLLLTLLEHSSEGEIMEYSPFPDNHIHTRILYVNEYVSDNKLTTFNALLPVELISISLLPHAHSHYTPFK